MTSTPNAAEQYWTVEQLAEETKQAVSTWNKRRLTGNGPPFVKFGRSVRYPVSLTRHWMAQQLRRSTSDAGKAA